MAKKKSSSKKSSIRDRMKDRQRKQSEAASTRGGSGRGIFDFSKLEDDREISFYKPPKKGKSTFDIIPFEVTEEYYAKALDPDGTTTDAEVGVVETGMIYAMHFGVGPENKTVLCLAKTFGKPCPICEAAASLSDDEKKALKPKFRGAFSILDKDNEEAGVQIFDHSFFGFAESFNKEVRDLAKDGEEIYPADPEDGMSVKVRWTTKSFPGGEFTSADRIDFVERDEQPGLDIMDQGFPFDKLLKIPTYQEVEKLFLGLDDDDIDSSSDGSDEDDIPVDVGKDKGKKKTTAKKKTKKKQECPEGLEFGVDFDEYNECDDCVVRDDCQAAAPNTDDDKDEPKELVCPEDDGEIGKDFDQYNECEDCDFYDECEEMHKEIKKRKARKGKK